MAEQFTNKAQTTLNGAIDNAVTSLVVTSATGFPTTGTFRIVIDSKTPTEEVLTVTAVSGTTFTVSRATEAIAGIQTAFAHADGASVKHVLTAGGLLDIADFHLHKYDATTAPTVNDDSNDGYSVGSFWYDVTNDLVYSCIDATVGAAIWRQVTIGALVAYTPTLTAATTNPNIGAGAATGHYRLIADKLVWFNAVIRFGTGFTVGNGQYYVSLPFTSFATTSQTTSGQVHDAGTTRYSMSGNIYASSARVEGWGDWSNRVLQHSAGPITWAVNDEIIFTGTYERT